MRRAVNALLVLLLLVILIASGGLYAYRVDLVWVVVKNDMIQKAPEGYAKDRIYAAFDRERQRMQRGLTRKEDLLERLFRLSQRLEKTQHLTPEDLDQLLQTLTADR